MLFTNWKQVGTTMPGLALTSDWDIPVNDCDDHVFLTTKVADNLRLRDAPPPHTHPASPARPAKVATKLESSDGETPVIDDAC